MEHIRDQWRKLARQTEASVESFGESNQMTSLYNKWQTTPLGNPKPSFEDWLRSAHPDVALDATIASAMSVWRSSFGDSRVIREAASGQGGDPKYVAHAKALLTGIRTRSTTIRAGYRVDHREVREGDMVDFSLTSVATSSLDAAGYESSSDIMGASAGRGNWMELSGMPVIKFSDGREAIASGTFRVKSVRPWTPSWEGKPGYDRSLNGQRTIATLEYVGPSREAIRTTAKVAAQGNHYRGVVAKVSPEVAEAILKGLNSGNLQAAGQACAGWLASSQGGYNDTNGIGRWWAQESAKNQLGYYSEGGNLFRDSKGVYHFALYSKPSVGVMIKGTPEGDKAPGGALYPENGSVLVTSIEIRTMLGEDEFNSSKTEWITLPVNKTYPMGT